MNFAAFGNSGFTAYSRVWGTLLGKYVQLAEGVMSGLMVCQKTGIFATNSNLWGALGVVPVWLAWLVDFGGPVRCALKYGGPSRAVAWAG